MPGLDWTDGDKGTHHDLLLLQPPSHLHVDDLLVAEVQARQALRGVAHAVLLAGDDGAAGAVHDATCGGQQNTRVTGAGGALVSPGLNKQHQSSGFYYGLFIFQIGGRGGPRLGDACVGFIMGHDLFSRLCLFDAGSPAIETDQLDPQ